MSRLKIVFMGTPHFSVPALEKLVAANYEVVGVYSQPPRPSGRGYKCIVSPVQQKAEILGIPVFTPKSLRNEAVQAEFKTLNPQLVVVAAYGLILPKAILEIPEFGCLNIHASLLPRWRGAAPIQRAIIAGDSETGVTIMKMDVGLDTGPMLLQDSVAITGATTCNSLQDTLSQLGSDLLLQTIDPYIKGILQPVPQSEQGITYADKLTKSESCLDWNQDAEAVDRLIRALNPWPGVDFVHQGINIKVGKVKVVSSTNCHPAGEVLDDQLTVACGAGAVQLLMLQKPGGKWLTPKEFLNGYDLPEGTILGN